MSEVLLIMEVVDVKLSTFLFLFLHDIACNVKENIMYLNTIPWKIVIWILKHTKSTHLHRREQTAGQDDHEPEIQVKVLADGICHVQRQHPQQSAQHHRSHMLKHTLAVRGAQRQEHRVGYLVHGLDEWGDDDEQENGHEEGALQGAQVQHICLHCDQQHGEPLRPPPHAVVVIGESFKALEVQLGQRQNGVGRVGDSHAESEEADGCCTALSDAGQQNDSPALLQDGVVLRVHVNVELREEEHGPEEEELRGQQDGVPKGHEHREDSQQAKWGRHAVDPLLEHVDHVAQVVEHVEQANHQCEDGGKVVQDVHDHHRQTGDAWKHRQCKHQE